ncbi:uncharacterized protein FOMMEDRAFT_169608 [Fomitiporia mediterranea MF3/22]|uniref:uncharacterized protein n=1 Tax=Fomitiporia mediterranea (strain MF3/22) TaxID=694068 RepID=UPI00044081E0|nr:uncharacterized protein FOMMEDRAFT_169608 [Fomitiporia mediterranea MF3/22]EJD01499.1 hypothetical protein FOMMEDRAFT_169608 [Fomitiporia mediterranea MF3/22]
MYGRSDDAECQRCSTYTANTTVPSTKYFLRKFREELANVSFAFPIRILALHSVPWYMFGHHISLGQSENYVQACIRTALRPLTSLALPDMFRLFWVLTFIFALTLKLKLARALPQWDGGCATQPHSSIGSLVPGATVIEAISEGIDYRQYRPKYLSIPTTKGVAGPATIFENTSPPLFYIHNGQLWQPTNLTSILRVNVLNVTATNDSSGSPHPAPLKIELGEDAKGLDGTWRWRGTKLFFDYGKRTNNGLYFSCPTRNGRAVYTSLDSMPAPPGCKFMTLHSFAERPERL